MDQPVRVPTADEIGEFWTWFAGEVEASRAPLSHVSPSELSARFKALNPDLVWELGPGRDCEHAFVISPGGRVELLPVSEQVVGGAPRMEGWELHSAKPPKQWTERTLWLQSAGSVETKVECDRWRYALVSWNGHEFFDVTFIVPSDPPVDLGQLEHAAWQLLDGEFGERLVMELFAEVKVVPERDWDPDEPCGQVPLMLEHVEALLAEPGRRIGP
ncbi:MAG: hypothetical protein AB7N76_29420 [Planctomycetota bacterium]